MYEYESGPFVVNTNYAATSTPTFENMETLSSDDGEDIPELQLSVEETVTPQLPAMEVAAKTSITLDVDDDAAIDLDDTSKIVIISNTKVMSDQSVSV